ncbi:MAG: DUF111 family protein, partial [Methanosarcina mazei]|nr:DUF111 family protein [Methanosarcina mazei]
MKSLVFNPFSGAAGDMILGCALDLGADRGEVKELIESSAPVSMDIREVVKKGIKALDVRINVPEKEYFRTYPEIVDLVKASKLPSKVEASA